MLCNQPDCLQMWLEMEAEGEGLNGRPILPPCCQISCLFSKRGEDVQINRQHGCDSSRAKPSAVVAPKRRSWISLWDALRFFSAMLACLPVWVSPHMWHAVGKGLKVCLSFSLSLRSVLLSETLSPHSTDFSGGSSPQCAYALRVELFLYGKLRLIAVQGLCFIQWLPCSGAPRFLN